MDKLRPSEYDHQRAVFNFIEIMSRRHHEFERIVGSLNGIWIKGKQKWQIINSLKKVGCFPVGYPDLFWPLYRKPYSGLYIELKRDAKSKMDADQVEWQRWLLSQKFFATMSNNENTTKEILMSYFDGEYGTPAPKREGPLKISYL